MIPSKGAIPIRNDNRDGPIIFVVRVYIYLEVKSCSFFLCTWFWVCDGNGMQSGCSVGVIQQFVMYSSTHEGRYVCRCAFVCFFAFVPPEGYIVVSLLGGRERTTAAVVVVIQLNRVHTQLTGLWLCSKAQS